MQLYTPVAISKFINLNIFYPLPYQRLVWDYKKDDISSIQKALDFINWERLFCNKSINVQASIFNETILNMFNNLVVNKIIRCNDKDPIWLNDKIKSKVKSKHELYKVYIKLIEMKLIFEILKILSLGLTSLS